MSYQTYTTEALVCGAWTKNTSDKSYLLFTCDAGMLYADARSVREEKSKQRYGLQDFSRSRVSLVKGRSGWRIGSVEAIENFYQSASDKAARGSIVSVFRFLRRFYKGEEAAPELYAYLVVALDVLSREVVQRESLQALVELRILSELGYVNKAVIPAVANSNITSELSVDDASEKVIQKLLEQATVSSQL